MRGFAAQHKLDTVFTLLVFCLFAGALLLVLLLGAAGYREVSARTGGDYDQRVCLDYLGAKIRHHDSAGGVFCAAFDDAAGSAETAEIPTLYLAQQFDGAIYYTRIYVYDGYLRELFAAAGLKFTPADGTAVLPAEELRLSRHDGLIDIYCLAGGEGRRLLIAPRSETGWGDE